MVDNPDIPYTPWNIWVGVQYMSPNIFSPKDITNLQKKNAYQNYPPRISPNCYLSYSILYALEVWSEPLCRDRPPCARRPTWRRASSRGRWANGAAAEVIFTQGKHGDLVGHSQGFVPSKKISKNEEFTENGAEHAGKHTGIYHDWSPYQWGSWEVEHHVAQLWEDLIQSFTTYFSLIHGPLGPSLEVQFQLWRRSP